MLDEPEDVQMGHRSNGYEAQCKRCGTVAAMEYGENEQPLLTIKYRDDDFDQDELMTFVMQWVLLKLERECDCNRKV